MEDFVKRWLYDPVVGKLVAAMIGFLIIVALVRFVHRSLIRHVKDTEVRYRARKFTTFVGYVIGILLATTIFSKQLGGLTIALGVAGAGIAFALQEVIASVAGWLAVSFGNFFKTGDRVQLGGIKGDVIDIGILRTTLMECGQWINGDLYNGRVVRVANSFVFKEPVFNYSGDFPFLWDEIVLPIRYGSDHLTTRAILHQVAQEIVGDYVSYAQEAWKDLVKKYMIEDAQVEPMVSMTANDNWMEYTLRYVVAYNRRRTTKDRLFGRILDEIEKTHGAVKLASATMEIVKDSGISVRIQS